MTGADAAAVVRRAGTRRGWDGRHNRGQPAQQDLSGLGKRRESDNAEGGSPRKTVSMIDETSVINST